jgi:hypothetical protein
VHVFLMRIRADESAVCAIHRHLRLGNQSNTDGLIV